MRRHVLLAALLLLACATLCVSALDARQLRGVRPKDVERYSGSTFQCLNGIGTVPAAQVNDEYCDCADGSDEPGTSACANSRFYCRNVGAKGRILPSSRVNDGVCDCCDGSDENVAYSDVSCPNTCEEAGRSARESLARELATAEAGLVARQALLEKAKTSLDEKRQKLAHYEKVFAERKVLHEQAKAVKEAEEAEETAERDRRAFTKLREEAEAKRAAGGQDTATEQANVAVPIEDAAAPTETAQEQAAPVNEQPAAAAEEKENFPYPAEYAYNPDAAAAAAAPAAPAAEESFPYPAEYAYNPDAAQKATADTEESSADDSLTTSDAEEEQQQEQQEEEEEQEYVHPGGTSSSTAAADKDDDTEGDKDLDLVQGDLTAAVLAMWQEQLEGIASWLSHSVEDVRSTSASIASGRFKWSRLRKRWMRRSIAAAGWISQQAEGVLDWVGLTNPLKRKNRRRTKVKHNSKDKEEATTPSASDEFTLPAAESARASFTELDLKLTKLEQKMSDLKKLLDRSYGADGEFEHMDGECYPLAVKQYVYEVCPFGKAAQKEGSSSTSLGNWEGLEQAPEDGHWIMKFKGGQSCWQGPQRSLTVHLRCGATNLPLSVDEPSKCVYEMHMETPAVCNERHAEDVRKRATGQQEEEEEEGAQHAHQKDEL